MDTDERIGPTLGDFKSAGVGWKDKSQHAVSVRSWAEHRRCRPGERPARPRVLGRAQAGAAARGWVVVEVAVVGAGKVVVMGFAFTHVPAARK
jgi:hypothetical protein